MRSTLFSFSILLCLACTHTCIRILKLTQTLCIGLSAYSTSLSEIKVMPRLYEYNIIWLYLYISLPRSRSFLIKNCEKGVLKGLSRLQPVTEGSPDLIFSVKIHVFEV